MITWEQAIEVIHAESLTQRDTLLVLLAVDPDTTQLSAALKALGKKAGVKGIARWSISDILRASKGQAVPNGQGWSITQRGKNRAMQLAQQAGVSLGIEPPALTAASKTDAGNGFVSLDGRVFIGHGASPVWKDLREFLEKKLHVAHDEFKRVSTAGMTHIERLEQMLHDSAFAFIVLTAEDEQEDGRVRARQNVVHEVGLFQGRLGFKRAIILLEEGCDEFSNIAGLTQIRFPKGNIMAATEEIRDVLERERLLSNARTTC